MIKAISRGFFLNKQFVNSFYIRCLILRCHLRVCMYVCMSAYDSTVYYAPIDKHFSKDSILQLEHGTFSNF